MDIAMVLADASDFDRHVIALARALADRGNRVVLHSHREIAAGGLPVSVGDAEGFVQRIAEAAPEIVHAHHWTGGLAAAGAGVLGIPIVQTFHDFGACPYDGV